jgi:hypothetical protein
MKRIEDYTDEELYDLDEVQLEQLVDLECAYKGIALLPPSPSEPEKPEGQPDKVVWEVLPPTLLFATKEEAEACAHTLTGLNLLEIYSLRSGYSYEAPYGVRAPEDDPTPSINERRHWTPEHYDANKTALERYESAKNTYNSQRREYDSVQGQRAEVIRQLQARMDEHAQKSYDTQRIQADFDRYMTLADGNREIALKFLLEVSKFDEDFVREAVGMPTQDEPEMPPTEEK